MIEGNMGSLQRFKDGKVILEEGKKNARIFVIQKGRVKVTRRSNAGHEVVLAELGEDQVFGEMSLIDGSTCSANVVALGDVSVSILDKPSLFEAFQSNKDAVESVMTHLFQRMRTMNKRVVNLETQLTEIEEETHAKPSVILIKGISEPAKHSLYDMSSMVIDNNPFTIGRWSKHASKSSWFSAKPTRKHLEIHDIAPYVISRHHCQIVQKATDVYIVDTQSRLGTWVNNEKVNNKTKLNKGSNTIHLGGLHSQFVYDIFVP